MEELCLKIEDTPKYVFKVRKGAKVRNHGICKQVNLNVKWGIEVILGMHWLACLESIGANFRILAIKWGDKGSKCWEGILPFAGHKLLATLWSMSCRMRGKSNFPVIKNILANFDDAFWELRGLPPKRDWDHAIILKRAQIPNICPHMYMHYQKNEIEKIVKDMLCAVRPNTNPFSSPVILVKKYCVWRFCIDYQAIDK